MGTTEAEEIKEQAIEAWLDRLEALGLPKPRPKVVTVEGQIIHDANPYVSKRDPNYPNSEKGRVNVRRGDYLVVDMDLWRQRRQRSDRKDEGSE